MTETSEIIRKIIDVSALTPTATGWCGQNPFHASKDNDGAPNFKIDATTGVWQCYDHGCAGKLLTLVALKEGLITCGEKIGGRYGDAVRIARQKYGMEEAPTAHTGDEKPVTVAREIMRREKIITLSDTREQFIYNDGVYMPHTGEVIEKICNKYWGEEDSKHKRAEVVDFIRIHTSVDRSIVNAQPFILNLKNGLLDVRTGELTAHIPDFLCTVRLPVTFDPAAKCPAIEKFFSDVVAGGDIQVMEEIIGYCLYRDMPIHKAFILLGDGNNGKSTFINLIKRFLGANNTCEISLQSLGYNRFAVIGMYGRLANLYPDLSSKALNDTGVFKILTGGDTIGAEKKFGGFFAFQNYAKMIFSCNTLPISPDDTGAFFRRLVFINFPNEFSGEKNVKNMIDRLSTNDELSGLLNVALVALKRLLENGKFSAGLSTDETREKYIRLSDVVGAFCMDCLNQNSTGEVVKKELYSAFCEYCRKFNLSVVGEQTFFKRIPQYFSVNDAQTRAGGDRRRILVGIEFKNEFKKEIIEGTKGTEGMGFFVTNVKNQINDIDSDIDSYISYINIAKNDVPSVPVVPNPQPINLSLVVTSNKNIQESSKRILLDLIAILEKTFNGPVPRVDVVAEAASRNVQGAREAIDALLRDGFLIEPRAGYLKVTG